MPDTTASANNTPASAGSKRVKPGFIDQDLEDAYELDKDCLREAAQAAIAPKLAEREWTAADQTLLSASLDRCDTILQALQTVRTGKKTLTKEEKAARVLLLAALDPIIKGARRKYADGSAERRAYGIGARLSSASTKTLYDSTVYSYGQLNPGPGATPAKDSLKGVLPSEIATLGQLSTDYKNADWAQSDAQKSAAELLSQLRLEIETVLNPLRRDCQGAADQAYSHRNPVNAAQRKAFGLKPTRSLND